MSSFHSDSSDEEDSEQYATTNVMLGYASKEPTDDTFSRLGGTPTWLDNEPPTASLIKCKTCNSFMSLLLQLNGDLPEYLPNHERRFYLFTCRNKPCRRKPGSIRALRSIASARHSTTQQDRTSVKPNPPKPNQNPPISLGDSIFKPTSPTSPRTSNPNPFTTTPSLNANPFSTTNAANPIPYGHQKHHHMTSLPIPPPQPNSTPTTDDTLSTSFTQQARISSPPPPRPRSPIPSSPSLLPRPYPTYHLDADYETLESEPHPSPSSSQHQNLSPASKPDIDEAEAADTDTSFPTSASKTFLRFAARLAHNPEQVLRYEYRGLPLLYSSSNDEVALAFPSATSTASTSTSNKNNNNNNRLPKCANCGASRNFEFQLTPHAITVLEEDGEDGMMEEGMEWGSVVVGVCEGDCAERGVEGGRVGWVEEWVGVSWEGEGEMGMGKGSG
ncbi:MAG: hypothetical protein Q9220_006359 [cf. Caloplaca sp. 1 TL-2023]